MLCSTRPVTYDVRPLASLCRARNWGGRNTGMAAVCASLRFCVSDTATTEIYTLSRPGALPSKSSSLPKSALWLQSKSQFFMHVRIPQTRVANPVQVLKRHVGASVTCSTFFLFAARKHEKQLRTAHPVLTSISPRNSEGRALVATQAVITASVF